MTVWQLAKVTFKWAGPVQLFNFSQLFGNFQKLLLEADFGKTSTCCSCWRSTSNVKRPGSRATRVDGGGLLCTWCDPALLSAAVASCSGSKSLRQALTMFEASDETVFKRAMSLLPDGFSRTSWHYCRHEGCVFNARRPGCPARAAKASAYCIWHDSDEMTRTLALPQGRRAIRWILSCLKKATCDPTDTALWSQALRLLPAGFALSAKMCANRHCCYSLEAPGKPARSHAKSDFCAWCDMAVLAERQQSVQGHRLIAASMAKWCGHSDVLAAAWGRLSPSFRLAAARRATQLFERKAMAKNDYVDLLEPGLNYGRDAYGRSMLVPNFGKRGGCECDLCGQKFLWRHGVLPWEQITGQIEDAVIHDKLYFDLRNVTGASAGLNTRRRLSDGRTGEDLLKCTLCYQAHCGHCARSLRFHEYLWSDDCVHCGMDMLPQFSRRPVTVRPAAVWPPPGHSLLCRSSTDPPRAEGVACTHTLAFQCSCCGEMPEHSMFCYLSWEDYDYPKIGHWGRRRKDVRVSRPSRRPGWLCQSCKDGRGVFSDTYNRD